MKYLQPLKVEFIGVSNNPFKSNDKEVNAYKIQCLYNGEVCAIKCTKDVYEKAQNVERYSEVLLTTQVDDEVYSQGKKKVDFRVVDVLTI